VPKAPTTWITTSIAVAACIWVAFTPDPSSAGAVAGGSRPSIEPLRQAPGAVRRYWTPARMRAARPPDLTITALGQGEDAAASARAARRTRRSSLHREIPTTREFPYRTHGKVFFTLGLSDYSCSATAVRSPGRSLVWTAGHCVSDPGLAGPVFATNWEFVPGYKEGRKPFGEWPATSLATTPQWGGRGPLSGGDTDFDFGAAVVAPRGSSHLQEAIGARRIAFRQARDKIYSAFGYPAERPPPEFDGRHLFVCRSRYKGADPGTGPPSPLRISCDMTGGASGGGWVIQRDDRRYVASVTSYGYWSQPNSVYGPYQGTVARRLYEAAGG
jgi:hypothetical protein